MLSDLTLFDPRHWIYMLLGGMIGAAVAHPVNNHSLFLLGLPEAEGIQRQDIETP